MEEQKITCNVHEVSAHQHKTEHHSCLYWYLFGHEKLNELLKKVSKKVYKKTFYMHLSWKLFLRNLQGKHAYFSWAIIKLSYTSISFNTSKNEWYVGLCCCMLGLSGVYNQFITVQSSRRIAYQSEGCPLKQKGMGGYTKYSLIFRYDRITRAYFIIIINFPESIILASQATNQSDQSNFRFILRYILHQNC